MAQAWHTHARACANWMLVLACLAGCASTPQASRERDAEAKAFITHPSTAAIYVYRTPVDSPGGDSILFLDQRIVGATLPGGFFRIDAQPGKRVLRGIGYDQGKLEVEARAGEIYFVALRVMKGNSHFVPRPPDIGRAELLACCVLIENWAPGQRPLLR